jgi:hypothetical protein
VKKEVKQVIQYATGYGFTYEGHTGSGHCRLRHSGGQLIIMPSTPNGGRRWRENTLAMIHRIHNAQKDKP